MKVLAKTTRGSSSRVSGEKRRLRDIVDSIYDEVENRGVVDYFANIKSAGKKYYIDYFRLRDGWMLEDTAKDVGRAIESISDELGYSDNVSIQYIPNSVPSINESYGGQCYIVRVIVQ